MSETPRMGLPLIEAAQAQKHVTHNEALVVVDALAHLYVLDRDLAAPPPSPVDGDAYLVAPAASGDWAGQGGSIAYLIDAAWRFYAPFKGLRAYVEDEQALLHYDGATWVDFSTLLSLQNVPLLGVGTTADAANPFSAKFNNALLTAKYVAEGGDGDLRIKANKEAAADTASYLFQTNFSGRAEFGLVGNDDFTIKVSPDGSAWIDALTIDKATGEVRYAQNEYGATTAPGVTDDNTLGYLVGSRWFDTTADREYVCLDNATGAAVWVETTAGAGGGEANTASNVGTAGVGLFKAKAGVDLQFKKLNAGSSAVSVSDDVANDEVDIDIPDGGVGLAKLAQMATASLLGRNTAGSGAPEVLSAATARAILNVEDGATADQSAADIRGLGFFDTSNDGAGSGLDADLLDGNQASAFATAAQGALADSALQNLVEDTAPQLGGDIDLNGRAISEMRTAGEALVAGDWCYLNTDGKMWKADASAAATAAGLIAMAAEAISANASGRFVIFGKWTTTGLTAGATYYLSETAGAITATAPATTGAIVRIVGYAESTTVLNIRIDGAYVERA